MQYETWHSFYDKSNMTALVFYNNDAYLQRVQYTLVMKVRPSLTVKMIARLHTAIRVSRGNQVS
jgi:hypothetical protein